MEEEKDQTPAEGTGIHGENIEGNASDSTENLGEQRPLVDDVRPPESSQETVSPRSIEVADANETAESGSPEESEFDDEGPAGETEPVKGSDPSAPEADTAEDGQSKDETSESSENVEQTSDTQTEETDGPNIDSGNEPIDPASEGEDTTNTSPPIDDESEIAQAAAPESAPQQSAAPIAQTPTSQKSPIGIVIIVVTVALALIALAVVSYTMMSNANVDSGDTANKAANSQDGAETTTPATASEEVEAVMSDIDQALEDIDSADATDLNQNDLSDATLGL